MDTNALRPVFTTPGLNSQPPGRRIFLHGFAAQEASEVTPMWNLPQKGAYKQAWRSFLGQISRRPE